MRTLSFASKRFRSDLDAFCRSAGAPPEIARSVAAILAEVKARGDAAVAAYAKKFDRALLRPGAFRVKAAEVKAAVRTVSAERRQAIAQAHAAVADFARESLPKSWVTRNPHGAEVGEKFDPIGRVGVYVPGGQVPLVSTVLMTAGLARAAGCPQIALFTPSGPGGAVAPEILAAAAQVGVEEIYRIGGVQAIGAMAYGTASIPAVDKIFGPGNVYVCEAKRQVFGTVGVDLLPGPSELMVIADATARADFAAADLLAQAEHGSGRERLYLIGTSKAVIAAIHREIEAQLKGLKRSDKVRAVIGSGFLTIEVKDLDGAALVANRVAPEHLELLVRSTAVGSLVKAVRTAGAIMIGNFTPTALGDFTAGPSHVLPTAGAGRFSGGLRVEDFLRRTSVLCYRPENLRQAARTAETFAAMERLDAHGRSVSIRLGADAR